MNPDNESKTKNTETLQQLEKRAWESGCTLDIEFDSTNGEGTSDGFIERGSFVATFAPLYDPQALDEVFECHFPSDEELSEMKGSLCETLPEVSSEDYEAYEAMMTREITDEDIAQLDAALADLTSIDSDVEQNNKLLNNWSIAPHDYNDDFTVTWEVNGMHIGVEQDTLNKFEELHGFDAKEAISDLVVEINKDAKIEAFDKAKIDPGTL